MDLTEKCLESREIYKGRILRLRVDTVALPNGKTSLREIVEHPGGVGILALDENGCVPMVTQYRYAFSRTLLEIPAGKREPGEEPFTTARRELKEEVGAVPGELIELGCIYPSPGFCQEVLHLYLARKLTYGECRPDEDEFLQAGRIPLEELVEQVMDGTIRDAKTVATVLKAKLWLAR